MDRRGADAVQRADHSGSGLAGDLKIVSGGQTGADRAALDFALEHGIPTGGWVPRGRLAEDGPIPERYTGLLEAGSPDPAVRTALNVRDSDATVIVSHGPLQLEQLSPAAAGERLRGWLRERRPSILNVAGPRASHDPRIAAATRAVLGAALLGSSLASP